MIDSLTRLRIKRFRLTSDIQVTGSGLVMSSYHARISCIARLIADMRLAALYLWHLYTLREKHFQAPPRLYVNSYLRKFSNIRHFKKWTVYCARYGRPDRYMRSSESEGFNNSTSHRYKKLECLKNKNV